MLGKKENKSLLELSHRPKEHAHLFLNIFHQFSVVREPIEKLQLLTTFGTPGIAPIMHPSFDYE